MESKRRESVSTKGSSEHTMPAHLTQPSMARDRRMSRMDAGPPHHAQLMNRRMSMYRRPSLAGSQRTDPSVLVPVKLQNTYRLGPEDDDKFFSHRVEKALKSILEAFLEGEEYEAKKCAGMAQNLTEVIKSRVKEMHFPRYKIVCNVLLGQNGDQCLQTASRCLWNSKTDNFATATHTTNSLFAVAAVYGVYFE